MFFSFLKSVLFYFVYRSDLPMHMFVHHVCAWYLRKPEDDIRSPGIGVTDSLWAVIWCQDSNLGPPEDH